MTWRDETPGEVQDDLDRLADEALSSAQRLLESYGEFYPFGVRLADGGDVKIVSADPGQGEFPSSQAVLDLLYESVAATRDGTRAAAFAAPVETEDGDAVRVGLEHRDGGPALELLLPYRSEPNTTIEFGELSASPGDRHVWA
jgi:hypothetical protein